jgi:hypothetical protein
VFDIMDVVSKFIDDPILEDLIDVESVTICDLLGPNLSLLDECMELSNRHSTSLKMELVMDL